MIAKNSNERRNHKEAYFKILNTPSETSSTSHTRIIDHLCTPIPSNGIRHYASHPHGMHRSTPIMLMEIMIQPQAHIKKIPWLTFTPDSKND